MKLHILTRLDETIVLQSRKSTLALLILELSVLGMYCRGLWPLRSIKVAKWLVLPTLDHKVPCSNITRGRIQLMTQGSR